MDDSTCFIPTLTAEKREIAEKVRLDLQHEDYLCLPTRHIINENQNPTNYSDKQVWSQLDFHLGLSPTHAVHCEASRDI